ncbi:hypothetical protein SLS59_006669 [Nothophoma quercina]|uniref:Uncharacterized protein n=1 Tax=Nothophoma quercina TaxID=749835 RepID=A0ABR3R5D8_9PLEO
MAPFKRPSPFPANPLLRHDKSKLPNHTTTQSYNYTMLSMDDAAAIRAFKVAYQLHLPPKEQVHPMNKDHRKFEEEKEGAKLGNKITRPPVPEEKDNIQKGQQVESPTWEARYGKNHPFNTDK